VDLRIFTEPQYGATYDDQLRVARATEELGFDAFFRSDHYLTMDGDGLPGPTDSWITLAGLALQTSRIRLGTLVSSATFRLPGPLAISVAQVDQMSGGRVEFGIGAGWFTEEHTAYGIPFPSVRERFDRLTEQLAIIDGLWRTPVGETFDFTGEHFTLAASPALPKPAQQPRPPIIVGGTGKPRTAALAARYGDEFNIPFASLGETGAAFDRVRAAAAEAGRELRYSVAQVICAGRTDAEVARRADAIGRGVDELRQTSLAGTPQEIVDRIAEFAALGVTRIYLQMLDLTDLDHLELVASDIAGRV
jgi:F420-dependent oxidoreductase-like protein